MPAILKPISELPAKAGRYELCIEGVMTMLPIYAQFDGRQWDERQIQRYLHMGNAINYFDDAPTV